MSSDDVDALDDDPDEDFQGDNTTPCIIGELRFTSRVVNKLASRDFTPNPVHLIFVSVNIEPSDSANEGYIVFGPRRRRKAAIMVRPILGKLPGETATYDVRTAFYPSQTDLINGEPCTGRPASEPSPCQLCQFTGRIETRGDTQ
jgi:hypothetical protein